MNSILQRIKLAASNVQQVDDEGYEEIEPKEKGYITNQMRDLYIQQQQEQQEKEQSENNQTTKSKANDKPTIYPFWKLHKLLSDQDIEDIIRDFYIRVWNDNDEPWFRDSFVRVTNLESAIWAQTMMWIDSFGGGRAYHGGQMRLNFHHSRVYHVMTAKGGRRWMFHMRNTLDTNKIVLKDKRIRPSIDSFIYTAMKKYACEFRFNTDNAMLDHEPEGGDTDAPPRNRNPFLGGADTSSSSCDDQEPIADTEQCAPTASTN